MSSSIFDSLLPFSLSEDNDWLGRAEAKYLHGSQHTQNVRMQETAEC